MSALVCQELVDTLHEYACAPEFSGQMHVARELFSVATGKVNDDDPFYDSRMAAFQEFFLFDYRLSEVFSGSTVFETFLMNAQTRLAPRQLFQFEQLRNFRYSIYSIEKLRDDRVIVFDLIARIGDLAFPLSEFNFAGFEPGQIFQGRMLTLNGTHFLTGAFIFHPKEVRGLIEKYIRTFLTHPPYCRASEDLDWAKELDRRHSLLATVTEKKIAVEKAERKRAIDLLNVTKQMVNVSRVVSSPNLVMALGRANEVSPFVPETPFLDPLSFMQRLAYCEVRSYRYKHIDPVKVYSFESDDPRSLPPTSDVIVPPAAKYAKRMVGQEGA